MGIVAPASLHRGQIFQRPDGEPATIHRGGGQQRRRDDLDMLCYMSGAPNRLESSYWSEGADLEKFDG